MQGKKSLSLEYFEPIKKYPRLIKILEKISGIKEFNYLVEQLPLSNDPYFSLEKFLLMLDIQLLYNKANLAAIPSAGPLIIVANHPHGILDTILINHYLSKIRQDVKTVSHGFYKSIEKVAELFIAVNPLTKGTTDSQNIKGLRETKQWLLNGGVAVFYPGGNVSRWNWQQHKVTDPEWQAFIARLAIKHQVPVLPLYIHGKNSWYFQLAGMISLTLEALFHVQQFLAKQHQKIPIIIGELIPPEELNKAGTAEQQILYLRERTYALEKQAKILLPADMIASPCS